MALRSILKISAAALVVLATLSRPCAAMPDGGGGGSFLDHAGVYRGAFSSVGSFHSGATRGAYFGALHATPRSEPQSNAMLLASLGLLGLIARRRYRALSAAD
jgi:MYXO-CTERM domain-containing protein